MSNAPVRVAIIGGGLAGVTLANALVRIPHLDVQVYESAPEFSERGAAVGLSSNALAALRHIVPSADEALEKAGAVTMNSSRLVVGSGPHAGSLIVDVAGGEKSLIIHRASLLRELIAPLPKERLHSSKKLTMIETTPAGIQITFEDGSIDKFDAVIGADGIFSSVRNYVLQDAAKECAASPAGLNVVPFEKAKATLGEQYFEVDRQYGWVGDGAFVMHDVLENRTMTQCVVSAIETDPPEDRKRQLTRESLSETLGNWIDGPVGTGIIDLTLDQSNPRGYSQWEHKSTPTYANGCVCIMGDAAHATTPWQGAGAGQAFEDAAVLGALLGSATSAKNIEAAFRAYDAVRRPRGQQVIDSSRATGQIMCGRGKDIGLDPDKLRSALATRWSFIFSLDLEAHKQEALEKMRDLQGGVSGYD
ncbi:hypothetical protein SLS62_008425 [Diatrype stigma]|uniref:FAD-binding domain-containing protein n=1 Tax=Diatrype stigma TaxID=117547 RepID=A0AAN9UKH8_9PEZI